MCVSMCKWGEGLDGMKKGVCPYVCCTRRSGQAFSVLLKGGKSMQIDIDIMYRNMDTQDTRAFM